MTSLPPKLVPTAATVNGLPACLANSAMTVVLCATRVREPNRPRRGAACQPRPMRTAVRLPPSFFCRLMA